jgi:DNA polymerase
MAMSIISMRVQFPSGIPAFVECAPEYTAGRKGHETAGTVGALSCLRSSIAAMPTAEDRRDALKAVFSECRSCVRCPQLAATRHTVVFGAGNADADLMFVGEAPGANEDRQGLPFVGQAGQLLDTLLREIGLQRDEVFITNCLRCRPPNNRDPHPAEIENCQTWLFDTLRLVRPKVVCTLGNFSTKLLRGDPTGITRLHGRDEIRTVGHQAVRLYPLYHPAAALYTRSMLDVLRADFARIPELLALPAPDQPEPEPVLAPPEVEPEVVAFAAAADPAPEPQPALVAEQMGLF